jgi:hypothetical protein
MVSPKTNPAAVGGGARIADRFAGRITFEIADHVELLKTLAAALTRVDAAAWAAVLFIAIEWGRR